MFVKMGVTSGGRLLFWDSAVSWSRADMEGGAMAGDTGECGALVPSLIFFAGFVILAGAPRGAWPNDEKISISEPIPSASSSESETL